VAGTENDDLISRPVAAYSESDYGTIVYAKGPLFFHALRQRVGDETFFALLQTYFNSYRYRIASGSDLLAVIDQMSGQDLGDLYQQWLAVEQ
jgi:aminopeptidase N